MWPWANSAFKWFMLFCVSPRSPSPRATLPIEANALDPLLPSSSLHDERLAFCGLLAFSGLPTLSASIEQAGRFIADMLHAGRPRMEVATRPLTLEPTLLQLTYR